MYVLVILFRTISHKRFFSFKKKEWLQSHIDLAKKRKNNKSEIAIKKLPKIPSERKKVEDGNQWTLCRTSDVVKILPGTVSLTICDCRPIRCTSHGPLYGYLRSSLRIVAERAPIALFISRLCQHCAHITRRTDPGCLSNNGRGLRSDHNRENSATTLEGRLDRGGIRSVRESSRLTLVLGLSTPRKMGPDLYGPHDVARIKETRRLCVVWSIVPIMLSRIRMLVG